MPILEAVGRSVEATARGLEARARRQAAISANIANADTPQYRAIDLSFAEVLSEASAGATLSVTDPRHLQPDPGFTHADAVVLSGGAVRRDGNDVDVDREMTKLARNQIEYQFLARALGSKFRKLKEAITGRAA